MVGGAGPQGFVGRLNAVGRRLTIGLPILAALIFTPALWAKRPHKINAVTAVRMEDPQHSMVAVKCQINAQTNRAGHWYTCVIDSGATYTVISDKVLKAEGPLVDLTTANGVIRVHQREVWLTITEGLELKSMAFVQSEMALQDVDILVGQDVLRQFRSVIFDYEKQKVEFHR